MKKFSNILLVIMVFIAIVLILNKFDLKNIIKPNSNSKSQNVVAKIPDDAPIVLIDAGHGFKDPGCESKYLSSNEADLNLVMAKLLKEELESRKIRVILTHNGKHFPKCKEISASAKKYGISYDKLRFVEDDIFSAYERAIYANTINAKKCVDLFISLHINSIENNEEISQYEIYYYKQNPYAESLKELSDSLSSKLDNYTKISALDSNNAYTVTRYSDFPSLLLEMGYATNINDAKKLSSANWRKNFCKTIANEIETWIKK